MLMDYVKKERERRKNNKLEILDFQSIVLYFVVTFLL